MQLEMGDIVMFFMPIFVSLPGRLNIDPLCFDLLVTLNPIFAGMLLCMAIRLLALALLHVFAQIAMWQPALLYKQARCAGHSAHGWR